MATLTSVNKEHLDNILNLIKTVEWRKKALPLGKHYGYETKNKGGCGKVTGEFEVVRTVALRVSAIPHEENDFLERGCVPYRFLFDYAKGAVWLYANIIENAKRYDKPKELSEFYKPFKYDNTCGGKVVHCGHYEGVGEVDFCEYNKGDCSLKGCKELRNFYRLKKPPRSWCYIQE